MRSACRRSEELLGLIISAPLRFDGYQKQSIQLLIDDVKTFSPQARFEKEQALAVRLRLLALVVNDAPASFKAVLEGKEELMNVMLGMLKSNPVSVEDEKSNIPKRFVVMMLVSEAMLALGDEPHAFNLPKEGEPVEKPLESFQGPWYPGARGPLFDLSLKLLSIPKLTRDDLLASIRLLVLFTRDHYRALEFVKRNGIPLLFQALKSSSGGVAGSQSYITIILRHVIEDRQETNNIMK